MPAWEALAPHLTALGLDPNWSRRVHLERDGDPEIHVLDRPATTDAGIEAPTIVCLHGNPTWSALWSQVLRDTDSRYRVVALDHVDMGWSQRVTPKGQVRRYATRVGDIDAALDALDVTGPVVLIGHDWGGAMAMGWAVDHPERLAALVLANTGIAVPSGRNAPALIRLAARPGMRSLITRDTSTFLHGTYRLPGRAVTGELRRALIAPYAQRRDRNGIEGFVADVPFDTSHPSAASIERVATRLGAIPAPVLLYWGARDPVFNDDFARDLLDRFASVEIHRDPLDGHLSPLGPGFVGSVNRWLAELTTPRVAPARRATSKLAGSHDDPRAWTRLEARASDTAVAFHDDATSTSVSFAELHQRVTSRVHDLWRHGVRPGDRVGILVPPSIDLVEAIYACWRLGAITVIADRGLGVRGLGAAIRSSRPVALLGTARTLRIASLARWAPSALAVDITTPMTKGTSLRGDDSETVSVPVPGRDSPAAVLFTSGATGPAKGVRYTHGQLEAQCAALMSTYGITDTDRLVAAFAPFALYGPAMGIASALPDVDVTAPASLTCDALERACAAIDATLVFASPAALSNVVATGSDRAHPALARVRTVMSAGAPIPVELLDQMSALVPHASLHTPYGMTEVLPVADIDRNGIHAAGNGRGVCVGHPVPGCEVMIAEPGDGPVRPCGIGDTGEVLVHAPWCSSGYDLLADTERRARPRAPRTLTGSNETPAEVVWHRSGDLGHVDADGRLWIEGRVVHGISTPRGLVTPVPLEISVQGLAQVRLAAAVGVGPPSIQQIVIVIERSTTPGTRTRWSSPRRRRIRHRIRPDIALASLALCEAVRDLIRDRHDLAVAAVLEMSALPVDIRHNAKIDRTAVATLAERYLSGAR